MQADNSTEGPPEQEDAGPAPKLRAAREAANLSVDEVAHHLHLSREIVLALEAGDFDALGAPVFVKGHLRSYARLLELDERDVVAGYRPSEPEPEEFRTLSMRPEVKPGASLSNFVLLVALGVILLVAAVYLFLGDNEPETQSDFEEVAAYDSKKGNGDADGGLSVQVGNPDTAVEIVEEPRAEIPEVADEVAAEVVESPVESSASSVEVVAPEPAPVREAVVPPPADEPAKVSVTFRFREESWAEVSDARRRFLYGLKKPGHESSFMGVPPFKIFLGNAPAVELEIDGKVYDIPLNSRGGNTARFTLDEEDLR